MDRGEGEEGVVAEFGICERGDLGHHLTDAFPQHKNDGKESNISTPTSIEPRGQT